MARHMLQHLAERNAHVVILVLDTNVYWFPQAQRETVRCRVVAKRDLKGVLAWTSQDSTLNERRYPS